MATTPDGDLSAIRSQLSRSLFRHGFSLPRRRLKGALMAVELSSWAIKGVLVRIEGERRTLYGPFQFEVDPGTEATAEERIRMVARELRRHIDATGVRKFICLLSTSRARTVMVELPALAKEDVVSALSLKAMKIVGTSSREWVIDAIQLTAGTDGEKDHYLLTAMDLSERKEAEAVLREVICHEVAHAATYARHGSGCRPHGSEWSALMLAAGQPARARLPADILPPHLRHHTVPNLPFRHRCPRCDATRNGRRAMPHWRCSRCQAAGHEGLLKITRQAPIAK